MDPIADIMRRRQQEADAKKARLEAIIDKHAMEFIIETRYTEGGVHHRRLVRQMRRLLEDVKTNQEDCDG